MALSAPANDNFANAEVIAGTNAAVVRNTAGATKEAGEPDHAGNLGGASIWFRWIAPFSGSVEWNTAGSSFDTLLAAYEGSVLTNLSLIASNNDDNTNITSRIVFNAISNETYYVAVDGFDGDSGIVSLAVLQTPGYFIPSSTPRSDFWTTDGQIASMVETNGVVYAAGNFTYVAKKSFSAVALNSADSTRVEAFPFINGPVEAIADDDANGFFVAGNFSRVGEVAVTNFVHIRGDLSVDTDFVGPTLLSGNGQHAGVIKMVRDSSVLYVSSGAFLFVNGQARAGGLVALDTTSGQVLDWNPPLTRVLQAVTVGDDGVYGSVNGTNIVKIDKVTGSVTPFSLSFSLGVSVMAVLNDTIYLGGQFNFTNGSSRKLIAISRVTGNVITNWDPNPDGQVLGIATTCERIYVGGNFNNIAGNSRPSLAGLDPVTGALTWRPDSHLFSIDARSIGVVDNKFFLISQGTVIQQSTGLILRRPIIVLDAATGLMSPHQPDLAGKATPFAKSGSRILVGGGLLTEGVTRNNVAAFDSITGRPTSWAPQVDQRASGLVVTSNRLFVSGGFGSVNGVTRKGLAAFDLPSGQLLTNWNPQLAIAPAMGVPTADTMVARSNLLYVGGNFTSVNGTNRQFLCALDMATGQLDSLNAAVINSNAADGRPLMDSLAVAGDVLYLGGRFTAVAGQLRRGLAAVDLSFNGLSAWNPAPAFTNIPPPGAFVEPMSILPKGEFVFAAGLFNQAGGQSCPGLAKLDRNSGAAAAWLPPINIDEFQIPEGLASPSFVADERTIYLASDTSFDAPTQRRTIVAFADTDAYLATWNPPFIGSPRVYGLNKAIAVTVDGLYISGGLVVQPLRVFGFEGMPQVTKEPPQNLVVTNGGEISLFVTATGRGSLTYQWRRDGTNIPSATGPSFFLSGAQTNDSGIYDVIVSNPLGSVSSGAANVIVAIPPYIITQPASLIQPIYSTNVAVNLSATVGGFPPPSLQWRLNGANIPGASSNSFTATSSASPTNAGSYTVIAANAGGAVVSGIATVVVATAIFTFHDDLPASGFDSNLGFGIGRGNNLGATKQIGETNHSGKVGGSSVWFVWQAPADGIATFRTRGSGFDTLLAAYTGDSMTNLTPVASDEDRAGYLTSEISFNAIAGTNYAIAIDGYAGAQGNIVLSWTNDTSVTVYPRIISQPLSVTGFAGDTATFNVSVAALVPAPTYQWYFGCNPISGATNTTLTITNVRLSVVGNYSVRVTASNGQFALSDTVSLQLGVGTQTIARDKPEDLDLDGAGGGSLSANGKGGRSSFVSVSAGTVNSLSYNTGGYTTQQAEPAPCAVIGGASAWVDLKPTVNGVFIVDTIGSKIDTVLSVYRKTNLLYLSSAFITCDDNSAPDRLRSVVRFSVTNNAEYLIVVDGVGGTDGDVTLNWRLANAPSGGGTGVNQSSLPGQTLTLTASSNAPFLFYQWLFNGAIVGFATNQTFTIAGVTLTNSGLYSVILSNFAGAVTNTVANVTVTPPPRLDLLRESSGGTLHFRLQSSTQAQVLEFATNLAVQTVWSPLLTNTNGTPLNYFDAATNQAPRFYRTKSFP